MESNDNEFWDTSGDEDFFSELDGESNDKDPDIISTPSAIKDTTDDKGEDDETKDDKDDKDDKDLFDNKPVNLSSDKDDDDDKDSKDKSELNSISILNTLKEKGLVNYELEDDEELTEELADTLLSEGYEAELENRIGAKLEGLPAQAKSVMKYVLGGGSINDYLSVIASDGDIAEGMDMTEESNQEIVMRQMLKNEGNDSEFIDSNIEFLKDSGNLEKQSTAKYNKWEQERVASIKSKIEDDKFKKQQDQIKYKKTKKELEDFISNEDNVKDLNISKRVLKDLPSYMNDKNVSLDNGVNITKMQKELFYDLPKNKKAMLQLANLLKNRNEDGTFNMSSIERKERTKITKDIKNNIRRGGNGMPNSSGGSEAINKPLAEYF